MKCKFHHYYERLDDENPTLQCPASLMTSTDETESTADVTWDQPTSADNSDGDVTVTTNPSSGSSFAVGTNPVVITARDSSQNEASCTFNVIVQGKVY